MTSSQADRGTNRQRDGCTKTEGTTDRRTIGRTDARQKERRREGGSASFSPSATFVRWSTMGGCGACSRSEYEQESREEGRKQASREADCRVFVPSAKSSAHLNCIMQRLRLQDLDLKSTLRKGGS